MTAFLSGGGHLFSGHSSLRAAGTLWTRLNDLRFDFRPNRNDCRIVVLRRYVVTAERWERLTITSPSLRSAGGVLDFPRGLDFLRELVFRLSR